MQDLLTAAYDPVFWLHHSYVDRQLAFWQEVNKLRKNEIGSFDDMDKPLDPFNRSEYNQVQMTFDNSRPKDGLDYKNKFCYEYDTLLFDNMTPEEFLEKENAKLGAKSCVGSEEQCVAIMADNMMHIINVRRLTALRSRAVRW